jgi:hypothetical protein
VPKLARWLPALLGQPLGRRLLTHEGRTRPRVRSFSLGRPSLPCYASEVTDRDSWLLPQIQAVRDILAQASGYLSDWRIAETNELLAAEEPTEALLGIASDLGPYRDELPERVVQLLKNEVGDETGVHPAFRH